MGVHSLTLIFTNCFGSSETTFKASLITAERVTKGLRLVRMALAMGRLRLRRPT